MSGKFNETMSSLISRFRANNQTRQTEARAKEQKRKSFYSKFHSLMQSATAECSSSLAGVAGNKDDSAVNITNVESWYQITLSVTEWDGKKNGVTFRVAADYDREQIVLQKEKINKDGFEDQSRRDLSQLDENTLGEILESQIIKCFKEITGVS
jgi:hypothetical protein